MDNDCTYLYFKPSGKWAYEGRGVFPDKRGYYEIDHDLIFEFNGGMPGITGYGKHLTVVVIPDESCQCLGAYPRMIKHES